MTDKQNIQVNINGEVRKIPRQDLLHSTELKSKKYDIYVGMLVISTLSSVIVICTTGKTLQIVSSIILVSILFLLYHFIKLLIGKYSIGRRIGRANNIVGEAKKDHQSSAEIKIAMLERRVEPVSIQSTETGSALKMLDETNSFKDNLSEVETNLSLSEVQVYREISDNLEARRIVYIFGDWENKKENKKRIEIELLLEENNKPKKIVIKKYDDSGVKDFGSSGYIDWNNIIFTIKDNDELVQEELLYRDSSMPEKLRAIAAEFKRKYIDRPDLINQDLQTYETERIRLINNYKRIQNESGNNDYKVSVYFRENVPINEKLDVVLTVEILQELLQIQDQK